MADNSFESILSELKNNTKEVEKGNYTVKEITLKQQRKILNGGFEAIEMPAKLANIYNEFIKESVYRSDTMVDVLQITTVDIKPFILIQLRKNTFGDTFVEETEDEEGVSKEYAIYEPTDTDFESTIKPEKIKSGDVEIVLNVPTLDKETRYNSLLIGALAPMRKKKVDDSILGQIADTYQIYEMLKYISEINFNGKTYDFDKVPMPQKMKFLDSISPVIVNSINDYIKKVKSSEDKAYTAVSEDGSTTKIDVNTIFFNK